MSNSNSDFILVEDPSGNCVRAQTNDIEVELCTSEFHVKNCSCFQNHEEKIRKLQDLIELLRTFI